MRVQCINGQDSHELHTRLRGSNNLFTLSNRQNLSSFQTPITPRYEHLIYRLYSDPKALYYLTALYPITMALILIVQYCSVEKCE